MENKNSYNFEVRITDVRTGEEKYVGMSNCIFLVASEDGGTRLVRLSECGLFTKSATYAYASYVLQTSFKKEPIFGAVVHGLLKCYPIFKEEV